MSAIFTNYFGIQNAKNFERFITGAYGNTYITIGRNVDWPNNDTPPVANNSANSFYDYWNNIVALKRITAADMNLVVPRIDWVSGNTYIAYSQDIDLHQKSNVNNIQFDYQFYVRNSKDQVFKCLANNFTANTQTAKSTVMPELSIGGQLPEDPYIETSDGYKWKYMYTIPPGLKQKFFTKQFMPVTAEPIVTSTALSGGLSVFKITDKGNGYNNNIPATSLNVANVTGDGTGANVTVKIANTVTSNGNIVEINSIDAGSGYTRAIVTINDPLKQISSNTASIVAIIPPPGGHGSDIPRELGASNLMISVDFNGDEDGILPVGASEVHGIRQVGILMDPRTESTNGYATGQVYRGTTKYTLTNSGVFLHDEIVYQGTSPESATFSGIVEHFDSSLYLTNIQGTLATEKEIKGNTSGATAFVVGQYTDDLKKYSGKLLYIEDTSEILRSITEIAQFKFTLRF